MLVALAVNAQEIIVTEPIALPATLNVTNVTYRSEGMPDFVIEEGQDYAGTYFDMGAHDSSNDTLLYAEWDVTIEPITYNIAVDVYNTNSWRVQLYLLNLDGDTVKSLRYKGSSGQKGQFAIGSIDMSDLEAGVYKVRARAATAWSAMKLKDVIFEADYHGVNVNLPGALLPAYAELSAGASVTNNAIAFKPSTANTEYATWNVSFAKAGEYNITIDITAPNGHNYGVALLDGEKEVGAVNEGGQHGDTGVKELGAISVPAAGNYVVKLTNATQWSEAVLNSITFNAPAEDPTFYLKLSSDWASWPAKYAIYYFDDETNGWSDFMTAVPEEENIYVGTIPGGFADDKIIFVRLDGEATVPNWDDKWSQTVNLEIPEGKDFFTVTSGGTGSECNGEWSKYGEEYVPVLPNGFYLVGTFGGEEEWSFEKLDATKMFAANPETEGEYLLDYTLAAGDRFKAVYVENDNLQTWYPEGTGNDYAVTEWTAGEKTIYFRPTYQEAWGGHFYIQANEPVVTYSDFEIDLRQGQLGTDNSNPNNKYLAINGEEYIYTDAMPFAYNAYLTTAKYNGNQHGYVNLVVTMPVEAGNYKITIGNCSYNNKNGAVKNADGTETLDLIDKNGQTITAIETPENCYHQNTTENVTSVWFVAEAAQTIQIVCPQYAPYIKVEQVDEVPEEVIVYTVTFAHAEGATGALPANLVDLAPTTAITLPKNTSMYKEGYTFESWTDGEDFYDPGFEYEVSDDVTFTAVYAENTVSLAGRTEAVTIKWEFSQSKGVAPINVSGKETFVVAQATIGESKIDVKLPIDATVGKFVNSANSWTQINPGVIFSIPSAKDAVITYKQYDNGVETTPEINVSETDATYQLVAEGTSGQLYYEYVQVALPKPTATSVENVEDGVKAQKMIENGQMVIIKNGVRYNAQGAVLK